MVCRSSSTVVVSHFLSSHNRLPLGSLAYSVYPPHALSYDGAFVLFRLTSLCGTALVVVRRRVGIAG